MTTPATDRSAAAARRRRRLDLLIGVSLGIVVGIAILAAFLFLGSEETIDASRISGAGSGPPAKVRPLDRPPAQPRRVN